MKNIVSVLLVVCLFLLLVGCKEEVETTELVTLAEETTDNNESKDTNEEKASVILATTTSTENSGLLDYILPEFEEKYNREVKVVAVGTGKALAMGENGEADVLLVHAKDSEVAFVEAGHGIERLDVMYNDFVVLGPIGQDLISEEKEDAVKTLTSLANGGATFVSRGDNSGTNKKEISLWKEAGIELVGDWYVSTGKGMGDTITMTDELQAYTLSDRATYLSMMNDLELYVVGEGDSLLFNQYGVIAVNPNKNSLINAEGANEFIEWLLDEECQAMIEVFGVEEFGQPLFIPYSN